MMLYYREYNPFINCLPAHVDSANNYTHALTMVTRLYFSFTETGYEASQIHELGMYVCM